MNLEEFNVDSFSIQITKRLIWHQMSFSCMSYKMLWFFTKTKPKKEIKIQRTQAKYLVREALNAIVNISINLIISSILRKEWAHTVQSNWCRKKGHCPWGLPSLIGCHTDTPWCQLWYNLLHWLPGVASKQVLCMRRYYYDTDNISSFFYL